MTTKSTSPSREKFERAAGFVLCHRTSRGRSYLILHHVRGDHWALPKGRIEGSETDMVAARRELCEETGICDVRRVQGFRMESRYDFIRDGTRVRKTVAYFLGEVDSESVRLSDEHTAAAWLDVDAASRRLTHTETARILRAADHYLAAPHDRDPFQENDG